MLRAPFSLTQLRWRRRLRSLFALLLLIGMALAAWVWLPAPVHTVLLVDVIDGDSLIVRQDGHTVTIRLIGIDAAEYRQDCTRHDGSRWPCGREARSALARLAGGGELHCEVAAKDRYDRTLAACRTRPFPEGIDLGAEMVRSGWAVATSDSYSTEEGEARAKQRGIWHGDFMQPADWRAAHERPATMLRAPDR